MGSRFGGGDGQDLHLALATLVPALVALDFLGRDANITRAAATIAVSQPTLSRMIRRWEQALGVDLIAPAGREIRLTPSGRALTQAAEKTLLVLVGMLESKAPSADPGLRVGYLRSLSTTIVAELVSSFRATRPDIPLTQREGSTQELLEQLDSSQLDLAVVSPRPPARFDWIQLGRQRLVLAVSTSHPLANRSTTHLDEVRDEPFLALDERFATRTQADRLIAEAGFTPHIAVQTDNLRTLREYVAEGHGVAILPLDGTQDGRVRTIAIESQESVRDVGLAWLRSVPLTEPARALCDVADSINARYPGWGDLLHD